MKTAIFIDRRHSDINYGQTVDVIGEEKVILDINKEFIHNTVEIIPHGEKHYTYIVLDTDLIYSDETDCFEIKNQLTSHQEA